MHDHLECGPTGRTRPGRLLGGWLLAVLALTAGCSDFPEGPPIDLIDRDRHAHFSADGQCVVYYRNDERPGETPGIYRLDLANGEVHRLAAAIIAGLDLHPQTDSVAFSARATGEVEPSLWLMGLDGGGVRRLGGGGTGPGYRWPAFSADGQRIAYEIRFQDAPGLDTVTTLWIGDWDDGIVDPRQVGPGRNSAWRPDGGALVVERRRPAGAVPHLIVVMDTLGRVLDTLGIGSEPAWRPDGMMVAYLSESEPDCLGVCFVPPVGGAATPLSAEFMSFPGEWSRDGTEFVYARLMGRSFLSEDSNIRIEASRLWIRTVATGADRQVTF